MRKLYHSKSVKLNGFFRNIAIVCSLGLLNTTQAQLEWTLQGTSIAGTANNMGTSGDRTGSTVNLSKDGMTLAVGSPTHTFSGQAFTNGGKVTIYSWNGSAWTPKGNALFGSVDGEQFGGTLSLNANGTCVAVGTALNFVVGFARVYTFTGGAWTQMGSDFTGAASEELGKSISLSENGMVLAIGSPGATNIASKAGRVQVYAWNGSSWLARGSEIQGEAMDDYFGSKVALSANGNRLVASSPNSDDPSDNAGSVRVFDWNGSAWSQIGTTFKGTIELAYLGSAIEISSNGNILAIASPFFVTSGSVTGITYIYTFNGSNWIQKGSAIIGVGDEGLGNALAMSRSCDTLAIGAKNYAEDPNFSVGKVKTFRWNGSAWITLGTELKGSRAYDNFGTAVSLSANGKIVAIGAMGSDDLGNDGGKVGVYSLSCSGFTTITHQPISQTICGSSLATLGVTASGANFTYLWSNAATTRSIQVGAGTYTVTITGECGLAFSNTVTVTSFANTQITLQPQSQTICGSNLVTLSVAGTGTNITYLWSNGASTPTIQTALAGTYRATVSGTCGLVVSSVVSVTTIANTSIVQQPVSRTVCGSSLATQGVTATGSNLTYLWSNGATTRSIQTNMPNSYTVTVNGFCGTAISNIATVTTIANTQITLQPQNQTLCGSNVITLNVAGTGSNITYLWSNGASTPTIQPSLAGAYTATVSGTCGSISSSAAQVTIGALPSITGISPSTVVAANRTTDLSVTATGSNLQYRWSNGATTRTITSVGAGEYFVTVTGACGSVVSKGVLVGNLILATDNSGYTYVTSFGTYGDQTNQFGAPNGVTIGADGRIYIVDNTNHRVSVWSQNGTTFTPLTTFGTEGDANNQFTLPRDIHIGADGKIFVTDLNNSRVSVWQQSGNTYLPFTTFGTQGNANNQFDNNNLQGITTSADGKVYIADGNNNRVSVWTRSGNTYIPFAVFGSEGSGENQLSGPRDIAIGTDGKIFVADQYNNRISVWNFNGANYTHLLNFGSYGTAPNELAFPYRINVLESKIYISEVGNHRVSVWTQSGNTFGNFATFGSYGFENGEFYNPSGVQIKDKYVFVAEFSNSRVSVWKTPVPIYYLQVTFDITAPTTFTGSTATLTWPTVNGVNFAVTYCLRISKDRTMGSGVKTVCGLTSNSYTYNPNDPNGRTEAGLEEYFWQVAGVDEEGNKSQWSEVQRFSLDATATSLSDANSSVAKVSIYPNPNNGNWSLETDKSGELRITNLLGTLVYVSTVASGKTQMSLNLPKGIYIVKLGNQATKLVIE